MCIAWNVCVRMCALRGVSAHVYALRRLCAFMYVHSVERAHACVCFAWKKYVDMCALREVSAHVCIAWSECARICIKKVMCVHCVERAHACVCFSWKKYVGMCALRGRHFPIPVS